MKLMETLTTPKEKLAAHYHNTYDRAIENLLISLHYGVGVIDSSIGGLGGCPYAKGASGNVPTEDVLLMCKILDIDTEVNIKEAINVGKHLINEFGYEKRTSVEMEDLENFDYYKNMLI
jgi:hydroxymethylglutaryl-CoA lyase